MDGTLLPRPSAGREGSGAVSLAGYHRREGWLGREVLHFEAIGSTNDVALERGAAGAAEGLLVLAERQSAGRGRLGRRWEAPPGSSLLMTLLFRPPHPFAETAPQAVMACSLALREAIAEVCGLEVALKWPNDLIVVEGRRWRKLAGLLSEIGMEGGEATFLVVGIGLNVNVPPEVLPHLAPQATSLLAETGRRVSRAALLDAFLLRAEARYEAVKAGARLSREWESALAWMGEPVILHTPTGEVEGIAAGVEADGSLRLRLPDGRERTFLVGDVSLRPGKRAR